MIKKFAVIVIFCFGVNNANACDGCVDAAAAKSFEELATQLYDGLDKSLSQSFESLNNTLNEITTLVQTEDLLMNKSTKYQQVYLDKLIFETSSRAIIVNKK